MQFFPRETLSLKTKLPFTFIDDVNFLPLLTKQNKNPWQQKKIFLVLKITQVTKFNEYDGSGTFGFIEVQFTSNKTHPFQFHVDVQVPHVTTERQLRGHVHHPSKSPVPHLRQPPPEALGNRCPLFFGDKIDLFALEPHADVSGSFLALSSTFQLQPRCVHLRPIPSISEEHSVVRNRSEMKVCHRTRDGEIVLLLQPLGDELLPGGRLSPWSITKKGTGI